jgi:hypothetical protein
MCRYHNGFVPQSQKMEHGSNAIRVNTPHIEKNTCDSDYATMHTIEILCDSNRWGCYRDLVAIVLTNLFNHFGVGESIPSTPLQP